MNSPLPGSATWSHPTCIGSVEAAAVVAAAAAAAAAAARRWAGCQCLFTTSAVGRCPRLMSPLRIPVCCSSPLIGGSLQGVFYRRTVSLLIIIGGPGVHFISENEPLLSSVRRGTVLLHAALPVCESGMYGRAGDVTGRPAYGELLIRRRDIC